MSETRATLVTLLSTPTRDVIRQEALTRKCSAGDLVEAAVLAYLQPGATPETEGLVFARLLAMEETLAQVLGTLEGLVKLAEAQAKRPVPPPIAKFEHLYPEESPGVHTVETEQAGSGIDATVLHHLDHASGSRWWQRKGNV